MCKYRTCLCLIGLCYLLDFRVLYNGHCAVFPARHHYCSVFQIGHEERAFNNQSPSSPVIPQTLHCGRQGNRCPSPSGEVSLVGLFIEFFKVRGPSFIASLPQHRSPLMLLLFHIHLHLLSLICAAPCSVFDCCFPFPQYK